MVLQSFGAINFSNIQTEFGGEVPIALGEYYAGGAYVQDDIGGVPMTGEIKLGNFFGKQAITYSNIVTYNNWYSGLTRFNSGTYPITQTGNNPDVQLQLNSSSFSNNVTHAYARRQWQNYSYVSIEFEIYISSSSAADSMMFYMGFNGAPNANFYEAISSPAYQLVFDTYHWASLTTGIHLVKNGSTAAVASYPTSDHKASRWIPIKILYKRSTTNTFQIYFDGNIIMKYNDPAIDSYVNGSGSTWGFGSRTGGLSGDYYVRRVQMGVYPAPVAGSVVDNGSGVSPYPSMTSFTLIQNASVDDGFIQVTIPFNFFFDGVNYGNGNNGGIFIGTNSYITFGAGSSTFFGLGANNPPVPTIHIGSGDKSYQRIYVFQYNFNGQPFAYCVQFEGSNSTSGTPGLPNIVWKAVFLNPLFYGNRMDLYTGVLANATNTAIVTNGSVTLAGYPLTSNRWYSFNNF